MSPGILPFNGKGTSLPPDVRARMHELFRMRFDDVRIHINRLPERFGARAFACGSHLCFAPGEYNPRSPHGLELIAHELTHAVQQRRRKLSSPGVAAILHDNAMEREAEWMGARAAQFGDSRLAPAAKPRTWVERPVQCGAASFGLLANVDGRIAGSLVVHAEDSIAAEVTDLHVAPRYRKLRLGETLLRAAARLSLRLGRTTVRLAAQDNGSGRLTNWYQRLGFEVTGFRRFAELQMAACRLVEASVVPRETLQDGLKELRWLGGHGGLVLQCADDFEEQRRKRAERFAPHLAMNQQAAEARIQVRDHLRNMATTLIRLIQMGEQIFVTGSGYKHNYPNPAQTLHFAISKASWNDMEAQHKVAEDELILTIRVPNTVKDTVCVSYHRCRKGVTIFHCGETASGVGYGTNLG